MSDTRRILGIDPGSRKTGFGIIDFQETRGRYVSSGTVRSADGAFPERLRQIFGSVRELVDEYRPDIVAIESVFVSRNAGSALKLGQARSAALCATFDFELEVAEYSPREVKLAIVGTGAATKDQVQHMVTQLLGLSGVPAEDAADALAVALCHGQQRRMRQSLADSLALAARR